MTLEHSAVSPPFGTKWTPSGRQDGMEQYWTGGHLNAIGGQCFKLHSVTRTQCDPCRGSGIKVEKKTLHDTRWLAPEMLGHEMSLVRETLAHWIKMGNL